MGGDSGEAYRRTQIQVNAIRQRREQGCYESPCPVYAMAGVTRIRTVRLTFARWGLL